MFPQGCPCPGHCRCLLTAPFPRVHTAKFLFSSYISLSSFNLYASENLTLSCPSYFFFVPADTRSLNCLDRETYCFHQPFADLLPWNESKSCKINPEGTDGRSGIVLKLVQPSLYSPSPSWMKQIAYFTCDRGVIHIAYRRVFCNLANIFYNQVVL